MKDPSLAQEMGSLQVSSNVCCKQHVLCFVHSNIDGSMRTGAETHWPITKGFLRSSGDNPWIRATLIKWGSYLCNL